MQSIQIWYAEYSDRYSEYADRYSEYADRYSDSRYSEYSGIQSRSVVGLQ